MLKLFRQKKLGVKILLFAIVILVGGAMLVFLVPGAGSNVPLTDPQGFVAQVEGQPPLTQNEVLRHYQLQTQNRGGQSDLFRSLLMEQLINELIANRAVVYEAERLGLQIPPEEFTDQLRQLPFLYPGGEFVGMDAYRQMVRREYRMSIPQFETMVRYQLLQAKMFRWLTEGLTVAPAELDRAYRRQNEKVRLAFALFDPAAFTQRVAPSEEDLRAYFNQQRERYRLPEKRSVRFVAIDQETLQARVQVTSEEIREYYTRNLETYQRPERVRVRHILFLLPPGASPGSEQAASVREQAENVLARLREGADFAALAAEHSEHSDTKEEGGMLGWIRRGQTVPALEEAIFSLEPRGPARLVETDYGFHIVQVLDRQEARVVPLEEVRESIRPTVKRRKVERRAREQALQIVSDVRGGASLEEAAQAQGWTVRETRLFEQDEPLAAFGESRAFQQAAFRLPAENAGPGAPVTDPVEVPSGYAVLQLLEVQPAHQASFDEVRDQVRADFRRERGQELARQAARGLAESAAQAGDLRGSARRMGASVQVSDLVTRREFIPELGSVRELAPVAFSLDEGEVSPALSVDDKWVVFKVLERQAADPGRMSPDERRALRDSLLQQKRNLTWEIFTEDLRRRLTEQGKLEVNQAAIERLISS